MKETLPLVERAARRGGEPAILTPTGAYGYDQLLHASAQVARALLRDDGDLAEARVVYLVPPGFEYVAVQWGIWRAGGIGVPLAVMHPPAELQYVIDDSEASTLVVHPDLLERAKELSIARTLTTDEALGHEPTGDLPQVAPDRRAMILYTSGTTGKPKGAVTTHANIQAQVESLVEAWEWTAADKILHVLPLHHIHGIINVLTCALWSGAQCEMLPRFDAREALRRFARGDLTLFMAVPTIYSRLIAAWDELGADEPQVRAGCERMRLMVSGSAALPVSVLDTWRDRTGHVLLERYGMTEIGMALSNPLHGTRLSGHVGAPLPGVETRLVDESGQEVAEDDTPGEIEVRGPAVFLEYWNRPDATREAFRDGWFRTGDMAVRTSGAYRILGRSSVDILKTGGYKVSALEIEEVLRTHPLISECAVVGVADDEWGERVAACLVCQEPGLTLADLRAWAKEHLAPYKIPTLLEVVGELPRNAMGKVQKPAVADLFQSKT